MPGSRFLVAFASALVAYLTSEGVRGLTVVPHTVRYEELSHIAWMCLPKAGYAKRTEGLWCSGLGIDTADATNWPSCAKMQTCYHNQTEIYLFCCERRMYEVMQESYAYVTQIHADEWRPLTGAIADCGGIYEAADATLTGAEFDNTVAPEFIHKWQTVEGKVRWTLGKVSEVGEGSENGCSDRNLYKVTFEYALNLGNRPLAIKVNEEMNPQEAALAFPTTGGWNKWAEVSLMLRLRKGINYITLWSVGSRGPRLKRMRVEAPTIDRQMAPAWPPPDDPIVKLLPVFRTVPQKATGTVPDWMAANCNEDERFILSRYETCAASTDKNVWMY